MPFSSAAVVSYRLGGLDGVSVEAAKWVAALRHLGLRVTTVAGEGPVDHRIGGLTMVPGGPVDVPALQAALAGADVVVAENVCSLPLNRAASEAVAGLLAGRPAVLHHHDLPWQRPGLADHVPDDASWVHVTVSDFSRDEMRRRGLHALTVHNRFDTEPPTGDREGTRRAMGFRPAERVALQPTRAIARKNIPAGVALAARLGATYWLTGPAEEDYGPALASLLASAPCPVVHGAAPGGAAAVAVAGAYAAADVVVLPSTWEGFGNPAIEASIRRRPVFVGAYPVAEELAAYGFRWFRPGDEDLLAAWLARPDPDLLETNADVARRHFSVDGLPDALREVLDALGRRSPRPGSSLPRTRRTSALGGTDAPEASPVQLGGDQSELRHDGAVRSARLRRPPGLLGRGGAGRSGHGGVLLPRKRTFLSPFPLIFQEKLVVTAPV